MRERVKICSQNIFVFQGFEIKEGGGIELISTVVEEKLGIPCAVLMGANIANEVAAANYCEATVGESTLPFPTYKKSVQEDDKSI